ncbi:MAG: SDR family NAD(P)-dependent oxidoreductase [Pseudomonadota bacterium]
MRFDNKTVMITGAAGNLGRAVAQTFEGEGANLIVVGTSHESLDRAFPDERANLTKVVVDLLDGPSVETAIQPLVDRSGGVDILCAAAGGFDIGEPVYATSSEKWDRMMGLNTQTLLNVVRVVTPGMVERGSGKIVTVGANAATHGVAQMGAYTASKAVVLRVTEAMAAELRDKGVNVNCVMPSIIDTPENRAAMPNADPSKWVSPTDIAAVISFLCSAEAKAVHGALVPVVGLS